MGIQELETQGKGEKLRRGLGLPRNEQEGALWGEVGERWEEKGEKGASVSGREEDQTTVSEPDSQQTSFKTHLWKEGH